MTHWTALSKVEEFRAHRPRTIVVIRLRPPRITAARVWVLLALATLVAAMASGTGFAYRPMAPRLAHPGSGLSPDLVDLEKEASRLRSRNRKLGLRLQGESPRGVHIIIDQARNRLYLRRGKETLLEAVCSAGSGMVLQEGDGGREWIFDTPRGRFEVLSKIKNPVWRKPDWAFLEEGKPIPSDPSERIEYGTLGEYGLYFGNGFLIHGTLYERLLGRSVTHGCIRLGRDDLRKLHRIASVGTRIYIH